MQYKEYGHFDGPVMMFLHGGGVGGWMWEQQIQHFSKYHCVVPELVSDHSFSIEQCAQHLVQLLEEKANGKQVIVIGFSLGAQIAIQMLSIKPSLIHFSIINSALVIPSPTTAWMIRPFLRLSFPLIKNKTFAKLQAKTLYIDDRYFDRYYHDSTKITYDALIQVLQENMHILITVGNQEKKIMKKSAQKLVQSHPNAKGIMLNNIGHGVSLAQPAFFNRFVENWIKEGQLPVGTVIQ